MKKTIYCFIFFIQTNMFFYMTAPKEEACTGTFMPIVWSEKPI